MTYQLKSCFYGNLPSLVHGPDLIVVVVPDPDRNAMRLIKKTSQVVRAVLYDGLFIIFKGLVEGKSKD